MIKAGEKLITEEERVVYDALDRTFGRAMDKMCDNLLSDVKPNYNADARIPADCAYAQHIDRKVKMVADGKSVAEQVSLGRELTVGDAMALFAATGVDLCSNCDYKDCRVRQAEYQE